MGAIEEDRARRSCSAPPWLESTGRRKEEGNSHTERETRLDKQESEPGALLLSFVWGGCEDEDEEEETRQSPVAASLVWPGACGYYY